MRCDGECSRPIDSDLIPATVSIKANTNKPRENRQAVEAAELLIINIIAIDFLCVCVHVCVCPLDLLSHSLNQIL